MIIDGDFTDEQLLLTTVQAAKILSVGRTTIYQLIKDGELRPVHVARSCRISWAELERYVARLYESDDEAQPDRRWRRVALSDGRRAVVPVEVHRERSVG